VAKAKEADTAVEGLPVDGETMEMLENEVKKGKSRKFILIYKGAQIKKLIVFKKGPYNTRLQKAKKDGFRGEAVCGIVTGSGVNLSFQLAGNKDVADAMSVDNAVDGEPTKTTKLKEFLAENSLARKPAYEIVHDVQTLSKPEADDDAGDSAGGALAAAPVVLPLQPLAPDSALSDGELEAKCKQIKAVVIPKIKEAVAADPDMKDEIVRLLETASEHEKQSSFGDAFKALKSLTETVKVALGGTSEEEKKKAYEAALPGAELKIKTLKDHPQSAAVKAEFDKLDGYLKQAKAHAKANSFGDANKEVAKLEKEYPPAKEIADDTHLQRKYESGLLVRFNNFKQHQGIAVMEAAKIKEIEDKLPDIDAAIKARDFARARFIRIGADGKGGISGKIDAYKQLANRHGDYVGMRNNALWNVQALEAHPNKDAIKDDVASIRKDLIDEANKEYETNKSYEKARALLAKVDKACDDAKKQADAQGQTLYQKERDKAGASLTALDKPEKNKTVAGEITSIKAKLAKADGYAAASQYPEAMALVAESIKDCASADEFAVQQLAFNEAEKAAGTATSKIDKDRKAAVGAVQKLHDQLKVHPQEVIVRFELSEIQKKIDLAKIA
jgi:hypothetical protein